MSILMIWMPPLLVLYAMGFAAYVLTVQHRGLPRMVVLKCVFWFIPASGAAIRTMPFVWELAVAFVLWLLSNEPVGEE
jgi:hypothetical protein